MEAKSVLVTGGSGFIGRHLIRGLISRGTCVRATHRRTIDAVSWPHVEWKNVGSIGPSTNWGHTFRNVAVVFHLAGRAHLPGKAGHTSQTEYRDINAHGTIHLANCAAAAGVRRFIYLSSIGVHGQLSPGRPFTELDHLDPYDYYSASKREAEEGLKEISDKESMQTVIVRPPLVFGSDAPGNFGRLLSAIARNIPMPFRTINNRRSLVNVHNLVDFLLLCCEHSGATGEAFLVADDEDISTPELVRRLAEGMGRDPRLLPVPENVLRLAGRVTGRSAQIDRLCGSLQVSTAKARDLLGWRAPIRIKEGLVTAAREYSQARAVGRS